MKTGDLVAIVRYAKVSKGGTSEVRVVDVDNGQSFSVIGKELVNSLLSADYFGKTENVTKTKLAEILSESHNTPFTVEYEKSSGDIRTLRGRLVSTEPLMGRCLVTDLDVERTTKESGLRLVDNRTLVSLIVRGVKYTKK